MKKYCLAVWIVLVAFPLKANIYKWTDSNGNVNFSDKPHPGAEEIKIPTVQTYSVPTIPLPESPAEMVADVRVETNYNISIAQPEDQATIRNPQGSVSIVLDLTPALKQGDKIQLLIDDHPLGAPQASTFFSLEDIKRGSHTLVAQVVDLQDKVIQTSNEVTFYMMPPRVGMGGNP